MAIKEFTKIISPSAEDRLRIKIETERRKVVDIEGEKWGQVNYLQNDFFIC